MNAIGRTPGRSAVVSDVFAREYFGDENALGRQIRFGDHPRFPSEPLDMEVVGVAATARYGGLKEEITPVVYVPAHAERWMTCRKPNCRCAAGPHRLHGPYF